jgi:hypothetical protein
VYPVEIIAKAKASLERHKKSTLQLLKNPLCLLKKQTTLAQKKTSAVVQTPGFNQHPSKIVRTR